MKLCRLMLGLALCLTLCACAPEPGSAAGDPDPKSAVGQEQPEEPPVQPVSPEKPMPEEEGTKPLNPPVLCRKSPLSLRRRNSRRNLRRTGRRSCTTAAQAKPRQPKEETAMEFPELWEQIKAHEGQVFYTGAGQGTALHSEGEYHNPQPYPLPALPGRF